MDDWVEIDGVGRPCSNSLGLPLGATDAELVGFWRWFGNSQIHDQMGRPLVIYHGGADVVSDFNFEGRWAWAATQVDLAKEFGRQQACISTWERGVVAPPADIIGKLAKRFGVDPGYFFSE